MSSASATHIDTAMGIQLRPTSPRVPPDKSRRKNVMLNASKKASDGVTTANLCNRRNAQAAATHIERGASPEKIANSIKLKGIDKR